MNEELAEALAALIKARTKLLEEAARMASADTRYAYARNAYARDIKAKLAANDIRLTKAIALVTGALDLPSAE